MKKLFITLSFVVFLVIIGWGQSKEDSIRWREREKEDSIRSSILEKQIEKYKYQIENYNKLIDESKAMSIHREKKSIGYSSMSPSTTNSTNNDPFEYETQEPIIVHEFDYGADKVGTNAVPIEIGSTFKLYSQIRQDEKLGTFYVIQFIFLRGNSEGVNLPKDAKAPAINQYYCIQVKDIQEPVVRKKYRRWNVKPSFGALVVPLKLRFKTKDVPFDYSTDFSLGAIFWSKFKNVKV